MANKHIKPLATLIRPPIAVRSSHVDTPKNFRIIYIAMALTLTKFLELENGDATAGEAKFSEMDTDCLDLVKFFFGNEMIVGFLTLFQCFVLMCCGYMKSRHLREIEGETELNTKRNQYFMNEIK